MFWDGGVGFLGVLFVIEADAQDGARFERREEFAGDAFAGIGERGEKVAVQFCISAVRVEPGEGGGVGKLESGDVHGWMTNDERRARSTFDLPPGV